MFTLSSARGAIGNAAFFARGGADVREGRVSGVTAAGSGGVHTYSGVVRGAQETYRASFDYDDELDTFLSCSCTCGEIAASVWGCRHVAALMIAVCGGACEGQVSREGGAFIDELLARPRSLRRAKEREEREDVRLYPALRRESAACAALSLKIGRTRPYVVRSMADFARSAAAQESVVYGRELTFGHTEAEVAPQDAPLFYHIVTMAGTQAARGGELHLTGAALDQTMRLLEGREVELRDQQDAVRRAKVVRGEIPLPIDMAQDGARAQLRVYAEDIVRGDMGAYAFLPDEIRCAFGTDMDRIAGLLDVAAAYPGGVRFDAAQLNGVCTKLILPAKNGVQIRSGAQIIAAHVPTPVTPRLYVDKSGDNALTCRAAFDYLGTEYAPGQESPHIRRDTALEEDVLLAAAQLFPKQISPQEYAFEGNDDALFSLLSEKLHGLESVAEVMISDRLARMNVSRRRSMTFGLAKESEKLVLKADLGGFTQEELGEALAAYRQKRKYVRLRSGTFLSGEALEQAAETAQVMDAMDVTAQQAQEGVNVPASRALYLEEALKDREEITLKASADVSDWIERLKQAQSAKAEQPGTLNARLRSYQLTGMCWMRALSDAGFGGVLADDMGLGKTIQALALLLGELEAGRTLRALVVCPASLQLNWLSEAKRFAPGIEACALLGDAKQRQETIAALGEGKTQLLITSYDQLRRDAKAYENVQFTHVLLDEAQNIKNAASQAAKAVKTLHADHRFAMTGTPIENRLSELWSIFDFLMPGYLYSYKKFKERFEAPVVQNADARARENLHLMVAPFILRRMKADVLDDLPEKVETVMTSEMTAEQRKVYAAHASRLEKESSGLLAGAGGGQEKIKMLAGLTRLRQLCCDPRLCLEDYRGGSGKLVQLQEVVREALAAGHRILLFSQFTTMLELIAETLEGAGVACYMLTGDTDKEERMELVRAFNEDEGADVFLISLKAGGTGLNLTGADVVIHYDPWWNVAAQNQATDRAYRIGQTKGVQVIKMIAADSVEERILKIQESKKELSDGVLLGEENLFTMDADVLAEVLRG